MPASVRILCTARRWLTRLVAVGVARLRRSHATWMGGLPKVEDAAMPVCVAGRGGNGARGKGSGFAVSLEVRSGVPTGFWKGGIGRGGNIATCIDRCQVCCPYPGNEKDSCSLSRGFGNHGSGAT